MQHILYIKIISENLINVFPYYSRFNIVRGIKDLTNDDYTKKLKLHTPMICCYTVLGTLFSIIEHKDMSWIYSNLTQIMYHDDWKMFIFEDQSNLWDNCPFIQTEYITFDDNQQFKLSFIDTIIYIIDNCRYAFLFLDWKYIIPNTIKHSLAHTTLISGYNKSRNVFYLSDNYVNGKFVTLEIDMLIVEKAFYSAWNASVGNKNDNDGSSNFAYLKSIMAFKYDETTFTEFDKHGFIDQLKNFINSDSIYIFGKKSSEYYGYLSYNLIVDDLCKKKQLDIGTKSFHLLYEHKYLMQKRLEYMVNRKIILPSHNFIDRTAELSNDFLMIRNLYIKSQLVDEARRVNIILDICKKIELSKEKEKILYEELIEALD